MPRLLEAGFVKETLENVISECFADIVCIGHKLIKNLSSLE